MQYWDKPTPPDEVMRCIDSWQRHYPDFEHILFNKESAIAFIKAHYGQTELEYFLACAHPAMECDLFRLLYLYQNGGHYMDADNLCLSRSPVLTDLGYEAIFDIGSNDFYPMIINSMISCIPRHEVIRVTLNEIFKQPLTDFSVIKNTAAVTGPLKLTAAINIAMSNRLNNFILLPLEQTSRFMIIPILDYKKTELYWGNY